MLTRSRRGRSQAGSALALPSDEVARNGAAPSGSLCRFVKQSIHQPETLILCNSRPEKQADFDLNENAHSENP